jgi:hypothetical protein
VFPNNDAWFACMMSSISHSYWNITEHDVPATMKVLCLIDTIDRFEIARDRNLAKEVLCDLPYNCWLPSKPKHQRRNWGPEGRADGSSQSLGYSLGCNLKAGPENWKIVGGTVGIARVSSDLIVHCCSCKRVSRMLNWLESPKSERYSVFFPTTLEWAAWRALAMRKPDCGKNVEKRNIWVRGKASCENGWSVRPSAPT